MWSSGGWRVVKLGVVCCLVWLLGCSDATHGAALGRAVPERSEFRQGAALGMRTPTEPPQRELSRRRHSRFHSPRLRLAYITARQAEATAEHNVLSLSKGRDRARTTGKPRVLHRVVNAAKRLRAAFLDDEIRVSTSSGPADDATPHIGLRLSGMGRTAHPAPLTRRGEPVARANRVEYDRGAVTEWYLNGPYGFEQGFTVTERPAGEGALHLELEVSGGVSPRLSRNRKSVQFESSPGVVIGGYGDLFATDATGRLLDADLGVTGQKLCITVEDRDAAYPLVVDPVVWVVEAKLVAVVPDGDPGDDFGASVAIDGDTAIVGAPGADYDDSPYNESGAAYVFVRKAGSWTVQQKFTEAASEEARSRLFGAAVAISGDVAIVGAPNIINSAGSAYVFQRTGTTWEMVQQFDGTSAATNVPAFGSAVAVDHKTAVVGGQKDRYTGAAYVFEESNGSWTLRQELTARLPNGDADAAADDLFAESVAISGDTVVIGSPSDDDSGVQSGAAYVYQRTEESWAIVQKLAAELPDGSTDGAEGDRFGSAVAVNGDTLVVGAEGYRGTYSDYGAAFVYSRRGGTWAPEQRLDARLPDGTSIGAYDDHLGASVAVSGETIVVGSCYFVFERVGNRWVAQQKLTPGRRDGTLDSTGDSSFGTAVAISGDTVIVEAGENSGTGAAYIIQQAGSTWPVREKLSAQAPDTVASGPGGSFGEAVALSGDTAIVGDPQAEPGSAYVFQRSGSSWVVQQELAGDFPTGDPAFGGLVNWFGASVAIDGDAAIVGAPGDHALGAGCGAAYVFERSDGAWVAFQKLTAELPGGTPDCTANIRFGASVAVGGDTAVVGAIGGAYVFRRTGGSWAAEDKLVADSFEGSTYGTDVSMSSRSVAISGDAVIVGASGGHACVFRRAGVSWTAEQLLLGSECTRDSAVAISGDRAIVGVPGEGRAPGWAHVFARLDSGWVVERKLVAWLPDGTDEDPTAVAFGSAVAISGDIAVVGDRTDARQDIDSGSAYVFQRTGFDSWPMTQKLVAQLHNNSATAHALELFGASVAVSAGTVVIGAPEGDWNVSGSAYVFRLTTDQPPGTACSDARYCASGFCVEGICCDQACDEPCESCAAYRTGETDGTCAPLPEGATCGQSGGCLWGEHRVAPTCSAQGACEDNTVPCEVGYTCVGNAEAGACASSCTDHAHCSALHYCDLENQACVEDWTGGTTGCVDDAQCSSNVCHLGECLGAAGEACANDGDCATEHCAAEKNPPGAGGSETSLGICCDAACDGPCEQCSESGQCEPLSAGSAPVVDQPGRSGCQSTSTKCTPFCDGLDGERCQYDPSQACGDTVCSNGHISGELCSSDGVCLETGNEVCGGGAYECQDATTCRTQCASDAHCGTGYFCRVDSGECHRDKDLGEKCDRGRECDSAYCADSVCCNTECTGQCEVCSLDADDPEAGTCRPTPRDTQPVPPRQGCNGATDDENPCAGSCNGTQREACDYPEWGKACQAARCQGNTLHLTHRCDGDGACAPPNPPTQGCMAYACDTDLVACVEVCTSKEDCAAGAVCDTEMGECAFTNTSCLSSVKMKRANGSERNCAPYVCRDEECLDSCHDSTDCQQGHECAAGSCEPSPSEHVGRAAGTLTLGGGGCGCRSAGNWPLGRLPASSIWLGGLGAMLAWRRRPRAGARRSRRVVANR